MVPATSGLVADNIGLIETQANLLVTTTPYFRNCLIDRVAYRIIRLSFSIRANRT